MTHAVRFLRINKIRTMARAALFIAACYPAFAQPSPPAGLFEVASVRPHQGNVPITGGTFSTSGPRLTIRAFRPLGLLIRAYKVKDFQISSAEPLDQTLYDIEATAGDGRTPTTDELLMMLQALLADRFKLKIRRQMKEMPVYGLVLGKNGPKFKESAPDAISTPQYEVNGPNIGAFWPKLTMENLAERIRQNAGLDRPVLDKTGLSGSYDIKLTYAGKGRWNGTESDLIAISIFTAVQEQLGLKLEPQKGLVELLIVEHMEKPTGN